MLLSGISCGITLLHVVFWVCVYVCYWVVVYDVGCLDMLLHARVYCCVVVCAL